MDTTHSRQTHLDLLRIIATLAVVVLHTAVQGWHDLSPRTFDWQVLNLWDSAVRWAVPAFVMISGALFLPRRIPLKTLYGKYILRILTALVCWNLIYALAALIRGDGFKRAAAIFIQGDTHMWFLYMIIGLYAAVPLLKRISDNGYLARYFLLLTCLFAWLIPQAIGLVSLASGEAGELLAGVVDRIHLHLVLGYVGFFLLGRYLNERPLSRRVGGWLALGGFLLTAAGTALVSAVKREPNDLFYGYNTLNVAAMGAGLFILFRDKWGRIRPSDRVGKWLERLSRYSFGAYLCHFLVLGILKEVGLHSLTFTPVLAVPAVAILTAVISFAVSALLHQIPVLKKYIV